MALTGHLSDLSLSELIEFFCNQRKSGRLKVLYPRGSGYFYLQCGSVVDARIGALHGIDAVYYALTLPNAEFEFSAGAESVHRTINQPWTQVVLEGLRRLDEGMSPGIAFPPNFVPEPDELKTATEDEHPFDEPAKSLTPAFFSFVGRESLPNFKPFLIATIVVAVLGSVAAIGVPAGWYHSKKVESEDTQSTVSPSQNAPQANPVSNQPSDPASTHTDDAATLASERQRDREKKARVPRASEAAARVTGAPVTARNAASQPRAKKVVVTVTYDESGRVTQASGGDANALRIARQKRFPPGKAGSATVTIPIN
jgi:hypothetical protein